MPVTGVSKLKSNMKQTFRDIEEKKAVQFVNAVLSIGAAESREFAPVEYSTLVNSQLMEVDKSSFGVKGSLSYNTSYAAYLENNTKWKPRPIEKKKGPAWNPKATPHFLQKGFESSQSRAAIKRAIDIFKV